ncbi:MAG: hypothetical protein R2867_46015 [Caldilineaceae bacterium]
MSKQSNSLNARLGMLVADIQKTAHHEIYCDEAATQMILCANQQLTTTDAQARFPALFHHLDLCPDCAAEYELLLALQLPTQIDEADRPLEIPPLPAQFRPKTDTVLEKLIRIVFPGFLPAATAGALRGNQAGFVPVVVSLGEERPTLELRIQSSPDDRELRTLACTLQSPTSMPSSFATATIALETSDGDLLDEQQIDNDGELFFDELVPEHYALRLHLAGQTYLIESIEIP